MVFLLSFLSLQNELRLLATGGTSVGILRFLFTWRIEWEKEIKTAQSLRESPRLWSPSASQLQLNSITKQLLSTARKNLTFLYYLFICHCDLKRAHSSFSFSLLLFLPQGHCLITSFLLQIAFVHLFLAPLFHLKPTTLIFTLQTSVLCTKCWKAYL